MESANPKGENGIPFKTKDETFPILRAIQTSTVNKSYQGNILMVVKHYSHSSCTKGH